MEFTILSPAAGLGTRMGDSDLPKALTPFANKTLIAWALSAFDTMAREVVLVIRSEHISLFSKSRNAISKHNVKFVIQELPTGTADAISIALNKVETEWTLVIWGDHIGASKMKPEELFRYCNDPEVDFILPLVERENPYVYFGNEHERSLVFNETKLGAPSLAIGISDCGIFLFKTRSMINFFSERIGNQENSLITDLNFLSLFVEMEKSGLKFKKVFFQNELLTRGVNSKEELLTMLDLFS